MTKYASERQVQASYDSLAKIINKGFTVSRVHVEEQIEVLRADIRANIDRIDQRLSNVAYRFELVDLEKRVESLEKNIHPRA